MPQTGKTTLYAVHVLPIVCIAFLPSSPCDVDLASVSPVSLPVGAMHLQSPFGGIGSETSGKLFTMNSLQWERSRYKGDLLMPLFLTSALLTLGQEMVCCGEMSYTIEGTAASLVSHY